MSGRVVFRKRLVRGKLLAFLEAHQPYTVGLEACRGAHHWGREKGQAGPHGSADPARVSEASKNDLADA